MNRVLTCLALASLSIAPVSNAAFLDTYVELCLFDCGGTFNPLNPPGHGAAGTGTELDLGNSGCTWTSGATAEDADGDPVFTTIHAALANTTAGGTVHLLIPGIYRESLTVSNNVTIKGLAGGEYILDGLTCAGTPPTCPASYPSTPGATGIVYGATGVTLVLENVSVRNFTTGVSDGSNSSATNVLKLIGCRFELNTTGVSLERGLLEVIDSSFLQNGVGVHVGAVGMVASGSLFANSADQGIDGLMSTGSMSLTSCRFLRNGDEGLKLLGFYESTQIPLTIEACEFVGNGTRGIHDEQGGGPVLISNSLIGHNVTDGVYIKNTGLTVSSDKVADSVSLRNNRIVSNGGDGVESQGTSCGFPCTNHGSVVISLFKNTIAFNGGWGLNPTGVSQLMCQLGDNEFMGNASGYESSLTDPCTQSGTSVNQKN